MNWQRLADGLFLRYLRRRRLKEGFQGDMNLEERRADCVSLAEFFAGIEAENDPTATVEEFKLRFDRGMARIKDVAHDENWLQAQARFHQTRGVV